MQHFPSLPDLSYVAAESRTTTSICSEECCTGVDLAMTSKPICFKIRIQTPLPHNIATAICPGKYVPTVGCDKTQESSCLKSSIGQLLMWTSGLLFSVEQTADYSLSSCMQHATYSGVKQLSDKRRTMWNRSALVGVFCFYWQSGLYFKDFNRPTADVPTFCTAFHPCGHIWLDYSLSSCMQHATYSGVKQAFRQEEDNVESFSSSGSVLLLLAIRTLLQRLTGCCKSLPLYISSMFTICRQQGKIRRSMKYLPICPRWQSLQKASSQPLALCSELLWFIQFFSNVSTSRFIGIITKQSFLQISISR